MAIVTSPLTVFVPIHPRIRGTLPKILIYDESSRKNKSYVFIVFYTKHGVYLLNKVSLTGTTLRE
jgi:hypothetical protein